MKTLEKIQISPAGLAPQGFSTFLILIPVWVICEYYDKFIEATSAKEPAPAVKAVKVVAAAKPKAKKKPS